MRVYVIDWGFSHKAFPHNVYIVWKWRALLFLFSITLCRSIDNFHRADGRRSSDLARDVLFALIFSVEEENWPLLFVVLMSLCAFLLFTVAMPRQGASHLNKHVHASGAQ